MLGKAAEKVPGGKLIRIEVEHDGRKINSVKITGDFFLHPEDALEDIERVISGASIKEAEREVAAKIAALVASKKVEMVGINPEAVARVVKVAIANAEADVK